MSTYRVRVRQEYRLKIEVEAHSQQDAEDEAVEQVLDANLKDILDNSSLEWGDVLADVDSVQVDGRWYAVPPF